jgi:hypothetical protein
MATPLKRARTMSRVSTDTFCGAILALSVTRNAGRFSPHGKGGDSISYRIHDHRDEYWSPAQAAQIQVAMIGGHVIVPIFPIRIHSKHRTMSKVAILGRLFPILGRLFRSGRSGLRSASHRRGAGSRKVHAGIQVFVLPSGYKTLPLGARSLHRYPGKHDQTMAHRRPQLPRVLSF